MDFGQRLKFLREEKKITQDELAAKIGVGRPTIAGYETKGKQPSFEILEKLADYFGVSIDYLLGRTNDLNYKNLVFDNDIALLIKHYKSLPDDMAKLMTSLVDKFYLIINKDVRSHNKDTLEIYEAILNTILELRRSIKDFAVAKYDLSIVDSLTGIIEVQAKYKNDMNLLIDKLVQVYLESNEEFKKAKDETSSALEKHA
jgi:transcriptional regulator with XRE-family HTH domain